VARWLSRGIQAEFLPWLSEGAGHSRAACRLPRSRLASDTTALATSSETTSRASSIAHETPPGERGPGASASN